MSSNTASPQAVDWEQIDWDEWRRRHSTLTFTDQQAFYRRVAELYPHQQSFDSIACHDALDCIAGEDLDVVELGGWDGALAAVMLGRSDVGRWTNYDLLEVPQVCRHPNYRLRVLDDYIWAAGEITGDVFVACHTIEHLTEEELGKLFDCLKTAYVYLEAPLKRDVVIDWTGYPGSHILELSWHEIDAMLWDRKYALIANTLWRYEP